MIERKGGKVVSVGNTLLDQCLDFPNQLSTSNGTVLIPHFQLTKYAQQKGLKEVVVYMAVLADETQCYLAVDKGKMLYDHTCVEDMACFLDMLAFKEQTGKPSTDSSCTP